MKNVFLLLLLVAPCLAQPNQGGGPFPLPSPNSTNIAVVRGVNYSRITNAVAAAIAGDTVFVYPGFYQEHNFLKPGVNFYFYPGSKVVWLSGTNSLADGIGIFDDRGYGATSNNIAGGGDFYWSTGTNDATCVCNTNAVGALVLTNSNSYVTFQYHIIDGDCFVVCPPISINGNTVNPALFYISRTLYCNISGVETLNSLWATVGPNSSVNDLGGVYWERGDTYFNTVHQGNFSGYGIWANPNDNNVENIWITGDFNQSYTYVSASNVKHRFWYNVIETQVTNNPLAGSATGVMSLNGGKAYVSGQKIEGQNNIVHGFESQQTNTLWLNVEKVTIPNGGLFLTTDATSTNFWNVLNNECLGTPSGNGFTVPSGSVFPGLPTVAGITLLTNKGIAGVIRSGQVTVTNITGSITLAGITGLDSSRWNSTILVCTNSTGSDVTVTIPGSVITTDGLRTYTVTNKQVRVFSFGGIGGVITNMSTVPQF